MEYKINDVVDLIVKFGKEELLYKGLKVLQININETIFDSNGIQLGIKNGTFEVINIETVKEAKKAKKIKEIKTKGIRFDDDIEPVDELIED